MTSTSRPEAGSRRVRKPPLAKNFDRPQGSTRATWSEWRLSFRFVRRLPARRHDVAHGTGVRAGVGQTLGEETAAHAAVFGGGYGGSVRRVDAGGRCAAVALAGPTWQREAAGPTRRDADGLMRLATVLRHRAAKAVPAGGLERSISPALRDRSSSSVMRPTGAEVARESTARARRSAR